MSHARALQPFVIHYGEPGALTAPCGYTFSSRQHGLDRSNDWFSEYYRPNCIDCIWLGRPRRRGPQRSFGGKTKF